MDTGEALDEEAAACSLARSSLSVASKSAFSGAALAAALLHVFGPGKAACAGGGCSVEASAALTRRAGSAIGSGEMFVGFVCAALGSGGSCRCAPGAFGALRSSFNADSASLACAKQATSRLLSAATLGMELMVPGRTGNESGSGGWESSIVVTNG